jgi:hypothetical protein
VVLFDEASRMIARGVCRWAGVPVAGTPGQRHPRRQDERAGRSTATFWFRRAAATRGHRPPGEMITLALLKALTVRLAQLDYDVPDQDLTISLRRIPARPRTDSSSRT